MDEFFDDLSRILASPLPRRRAFRVVAGVAAACGLSFLWPRRAWAGGGGPTSPANVPPGVAAPPSIPANFLVGEELCDSFAQACGQVQRGIWCCPTSTVCCDSTNHLCCPAFFVCCQTANAMFCCTRTAECCGANMCCPPGTDCCPSQAAGNTCCPANAPICCGVNPGGAGQCCPTGTTCCFDRATATYQCCPPKTLCFLNQCVPFQEVAYLGGGVGKLTSANGAVTLGRLDLGGVTATGDATSFGATGGIEGFLDVFSFAGRTEIRATSFTGLQGSLAGNGDVRLSGTAHASVNGMPMDIAFEAGKTMGAITFVVTNAATMETLAGGTGELGRSSLDLQIAVNQTPSPSENIRMPRRPDARRRRN